ncbi:MAG: hypothetical protein F6K22_03600 [Okeania sp. SIO2F4]|uniref:hypothetical protein n=1 Tax=Okeania sp. SIO2F4 TaxID=2607790 RepID=UPI00142A1501|nr:hypothetical protein [Okeania sp. SIO2F4]NES01991.1 hypothetical protein [Okeania sp. SIO2F4]
MNEIIRAKRAVVRFCPGIEVEGFELPDSSYHVSITTASKAIGFASNWLTLTLKRRAKALKTLSGLGFRNNISDVLTVSKTGDKSAKLISIGDFSSCILYAASQEKKEAIALNMALTQMSLTDFFRDAFGVRPLTIEEKRVAFYKTYAESLSIEDWLAMDREDARIIQESLLFLSSS